MIYFGSQLVGLPLCRVLAQSEKVLRYLACAALRPSLPTRGSGPLIPLAFDAQQPLGVLTTALGVAKMGLSTVGLRPGLWGEFAKPRGELIGTKIREPRAKRLIMG